MTIYVLIPLPVDTLINPQQHNLFFVVALGQPISVFASNLIFALLIAGRLIYHQRRLNRLMGRGHSSQYTAIAAMVVESASINVVFQLLSAIGVFTPSPAFSDVFDQYFLGQTTVGTYTFL